MIAETAVLDFLLRLSDASYSPSSFFALPPHERRAWSMSSKLGRPTDVLDRVDTPAMSKG